MKVLGMEKIKIEIYFGEVNEVVVEDNLIVKMKSIEDLESFMKSPSEYINYDKEIERIKKYAKYEAIANGYDFDDGGVDGFVEEKINIFNRAYEGLVNNNYIVDALIINKNNSSLDDIVKAIELLKNEMEYLFVENLDINDLNEICNRVDLNENISISTKYNYIDFCTNGELIELLKYLNDIKKLIVRYNLSPLEICIFVNDLIRERKYKKNDLEMDINKSRSIFKIIKSEEIVCAGFSNLYSAILDLMNIKSDSVSYLPINGKKTGHASNIVHIDDKKYGINGLFEIDTTWGREYNEDGSYNYQASIENYEYFVESKAEPYLFSSN